VVSGFKSKPFGIAALAVGCGAQFYNFRQKVQVDRTSEGFACQDGFCDALKVGLSFGDRLGFVRGTGTPFSWVTF
jgi:hypothetical protein